jgi:hypothetical protein
LGLNRVKKLVKFVGAVAAVKLADDIVFNSSAANSEVVPWRW